MAYNTGNAIGSNDPRDLFDNAGNLDRLTNGPAASYPDRLGVTRKSWTGMEADFQAFLLASGYQDLGAYAAGLQITARNQIFLRSGEYYRAAAATALPYTLTGTWATDAPFFVGVGDAVLRQDIEGGLFLESVWSKHRGSNVGALLDAIGGVPVIAEFDGSDETAALQTAINIAVSLGLRYVRIDGPLYAPGTLTDRSNVIFVGRGSLTGAYRRAVYPPRSRSLHFPGIVPEQNLRQMRATNTPTVVFMGDSLLTQVADNIGHSTSLASLLEQKIRRDNPSKDITFYNRAIGGTTWANADSVPATFPSWYTVTTDPWLDYVEALNPDLIVFNFGMNDAEYFNLLAMNSVILKVLAWAKVPDIVLCTPMVSSLEADPTFSWASAKAGQEGRDSVAGYTRSLAANNGYGLIDINRVFNLIRDGRDLCTLELKRIDTAVDVSATGAYTAAQPCHGYVASCVVSGDAAFIADAFNPGAAHGSVSFQLGSNPGDVVFLYASGGNFGIELYSGAGSAYYSLVSSTPLPTSTFTLTAEILNGTLIVRIGDDPNSRPLFRVDNVVTSGGEFTPKMGHFGTGFTSGPFATVTYSEGQPKLYMPELLNDEIWGEGLPTAATQLPYGGNGVNHPTSIGAAAIYTPAVEAADFRSQSEEVVLSIEADIAKLPSLETYADNAAALAGGLTAGKLYKTATGELRIVY